MAKPKLSMPSLVLATIVGILLWLTLLAMFGIRFPVVGVKWSGVGEQPNAGAQLDSTLTAAADPLQSLDFANIALKAPPSMNLNETATIELFLGLSMTVDELQRKVAGSGAAEFTRIRVSERMEARLSGANFAVVAMSPEEQAIAGETIAAWKWQVQSKNKGRHALHLTLSALHEADDPTTRPVIRTFDKQLEVDVSFGQPLWSFAEHNWQW